MTPMLAMKSDTDIKETIDWLGIKLKKGNYTDERFMEIESQLKILRSLCIEPKFTQAAKPDVIGTIKQFCEQLN